MFFRISIPKLLVYLVGLFVVMSYLKTTAESKCVQIYYDSATENEEGHMYAVMLANLIGHFPSYNRFLIPIDLYKKGDVDKCQANFYLGSDYNKSQPQDFLEDYNTTKNVVVWMGFGFLNVKNIENDFGFKFDGFSKIDKTKKDKDGFPGFFREVLYKNQTFIKYASLDAKKNLNAAFSISRFLYSDKLKSTILARARHTTTGEILPWALQKDNKYLFSEIPLSYITESDRYLILADLLFDILGEKPLHDKKLALIRLEDVHSRINLQMLDRAINILKTEHINPGISLIPIFRDPLHKFPPANGIDTEKMSDNPTFKKMIADYSNSGVTLIWHGVTHQYNNQKNPETGISGDDYEFWDVKRNSPIVEDSSNYILNKLHTGAVVLHDSGVEAKIWFTPHYSSSVFDTLIFGEMFDWVIGRMSYYLYKDEGLPDSHLLDSLRFDKVTPEDNLKRQKLFEKFSLEYSDNVAADQFYPYEIYGDYYHQRVLPENLGYYDPKIKKIIIEKREINQILDDAKRNSVIRDAWASLFYHTYLLENETGPDTKTSLYKLVTEIKKLGYEFVELNDLVEEKLPKYKNEIIDITTTSESW